MRIVGGRHRGRRLSAPEGHAVRPTSDRAREAVFNILAHSGWGPDGGSPLEGATVLDAFCGTGALGLEALSRGATSLCLMDRDRASLAAARRNAESLGEGDACRLVLADATRPPRAMSPCSLVFLDPPYGQDLVAAAVPALDAAGWLGEGVLLVAETGVDEPFQAPGGFSILQVRDYGAARVSFLSREGR